jgi:hypothetical protein
LHAVLLLLLGILTVAAIPSDPPMLEASMLDVADDHLEQLGDVQIEPAELDATWTEETLPEDPPSLAPASIDPLEPAWEPPARADTGPAEQPRAPASPAPVSAGGNPHVVKRVEHPDADVSSFFGTRVQADRIVFLVDNSNSMDEGRFETALLEIGRSVQQLSAKQSFYVIFYSDDVYPMFHPDTVSDLVPATRENKQRLLAWLRSVPMCMGGRLVDAVKAAERLEPQVIFLLSDGVMGDFSVQYLTAPKETSSVIHTLGMTVPDLTAARRLLAIALANRGTFRPVGVTLIARRLAVARPIAKHRVRGLVWGRRLPKVTRGHSEGALRTNR